MCPHVSSKDETVSVHTGFETVSLKNDELYTYLKKLKYEVNMNTVLSTH